MSSISLQPLITEQGAYACKAIIRLSQTFSAALDPVDASPIFIPHLTAVLRCEGKRIVCSELPVSLSELLRSVDKAGDYYIVTCSCGVPECAGIHRPVSVAHRTDSYSWLMVEPVALSLIIEKQNLCSELDRVVGEARQQGYVWDWVEQVYRPATNSIESRV